MTEKKHQNQTKKNCDKITRRQTKVSEYVKKYCVLKLHHFCANT